MVGAWLLCCFWIGPAAGQELCPRTFWPAPAGTKGLVFGYSNVHGDVLMDPSIPLYGVDSDIRTLFLGYLQTFDLWGRTANVLLEAPYSTSTTKGLLFETQAQRDFAGFDDPAISLTVNLLDAPTLTPADFQALRADPRFLLGAKLKIVPPLGQYKADRLINVGSNRWAVRAELGAVIPLRPSWLLEIEAGVWFFGDDDQFITGRREQEPIWSGQANLIRRFRPGFWASLDFNYFTGGRQSIAGDKLTDLQSNSRLGATIVVPFRGRYAVKVGYSTGARTRYGADFNQFLVTLNMLFR